MSKLSFDECDFNYDFDNLDYDDIEQANHWLDVSEEIEKVMK